MFLFAQDKKNPLLRMNLLCGILHPERLAKACI
jgi:hypothetical protein